MDKFKRTLTIKKGEKIMEKLNLMINGLPGKMAREVARLALQKKDQFNIFPCSLTGPEILLGNIIVINGAKGEGYSIGLLPPAHRGGMLKEIKQVKNLICIDFTHPSAVCENARFYRENGLPFVMGTTGGDREMLEEIVKSSKVPAVIAPNMAKQVVALQAMMKFAAETFPLLFLGWDLKVRESHQAGKADTSGTAKAMLKTFKEMGVKCYEEMILKERDPHHQISIWGIPEEHLGGHGWHTYTLASPDPEKTMKIEFTHNINGRHPYAVGALEAAAFVAEKARQGQKGLFTMIDVLKKK